MVEDLLQRSTIRKNTDIPTCVALLYVLHYTRINGIYFNLEYCAMEPKTEAVPLLDSHLYNPASVPLLVLGPYMCTRPGPI